MRGVCYLPALLLVHFVNAQPINYERWKHDGADQVPRENQEYASPDSKVIVDPQKVSERYESFIQESMLPGSEQPVEGVVLGNDETSKLDDREKRSNYDDSQLNDADINRLQEVLHDTGKSLANCELADEKPRNEAFDSSGRMKRTASRASLVDEANEDISQDEANVEDDDDSRDKESDETIAESEEGSENVAELDVDEEIEESRNAEESDDANNEETEEDGAEEDVEAKEDDIEPRLRFVQMSAAAANRKETSTLDRYLNEVDSLDEYLEGLDEKAEEYSQLRDDLGSLLGSEYIPEDASRTRRETLKRISVDDLKSIPEYNGYTRETLAKALQMLAPPRDEVETPSAIGEIHEPQRAEREVIRVPKSDSPQMDEKDDGQQTKEEKELEKVVEMRKAEEAIMTKEQDEVIKAEHLAHTFQEDLHDVMREIRALKVEINNERKDAEKVSAETKEAQKDLEMHDERKYNARRKVDELYLRLTDLESDTCDNRSKRKSLRRYVEAEHYVLARTIRRVREIRARKQEELQEPTGRIAAYEPSKSGDVQQVHKADKMAGQQLAAVAPDPQVVARQVQPCEQQNTQQAEAKKKDEEYNNILQQIIIGEAQVKVEDVQVARAEEEAVSLHKRLSNVLSKLAALSIEMKNLQTQAQVSGKRAKEAQATLAYHDQILFNSRKKVNAARNLESDLQRAITDQRMSAKNRCSSTPASCPNGG